MAQVLILMATFNGNRFVTQQLESIAAQDHEDWRLLVSDDGSVDGTIHALGRFADARPSGQVDLMQGPSRGSTANFRSLISRAHLQGQYLAFCDQDDVWDRDHLSRAIASLDATGSPLGVYGCRMRICDQNLNQTGLSPFPARPLSFQNALVQNMLSGNTMVMTPAAARLVQDANQEAGPVPVHDWWVYQLVTGAGGVALLDPQPGVCYRQHSANVIGARYGISAFGARIGRHLRGDYHSWARQTVAALSASRHRLTAQNRLSLEAYSAAQGASLRERMNLLRRSGVYHQGRQARIAFWLSAMLRTR